MEALPFDTRYEFGIYFRVHREATKYEPDTSSPDIRSAKEMSAPALVAEAEQKRSWWRLVWPLLSLAGTSALRWFLRMHGIG